VKDRAHHPLGREGRQSQREWRCDVWNTVRTTSSSLKRSTKTDSYNSSMKKCSRIDLPDGNAMIVLASIFGGTVLRSSILRMESAITGWKY
jgi:hypothetical protein